MELQSTNIGASLDEVAKNLSDNPGIYMFCEGENILYVGKARNLHKRVGSYLRPTRLDNKSRRLMERANRLQWLITSSNTEALLLEHNFIKKHKPPYNITLRDDKSYPYIHLSAHKDYPLLSVYRGAKKQGDYYGPYPNASSVHRSISQLQKIFKIRSCSDSFFANRSRPCLQHQIERCSAPCVGGISQRSYMKNINYVKDFLSGKDAELIEQLSTDMQKAANNCKFEEAAELRDMIQAMRNIQENQYINREFGDIDLLSVYSHTNIACVYLMLVRGGKILDSKNFFFRAPAFDRENNLLDSFVKQYYLTPDSEVPNELISDYPISSEIRNDLIETCAIRKTKQIKLKHIVRGTRKRWLDMAHESCRSLLISHINNKRDLSEKFEGLWNVLGINSLSSNDNQGLDRIECFDISHISGKETQASCVVFTDEGAAKKEYRRFNIKDITAGDDYAAMKQAVTRRYASLLNKIKKIDRTKNCDNVDGVNEEKFLRLPSLILIDGGKGQLNAAILALRELQLNEIFSNRAEEIVIIAISKDENRTFGKEKLLISRNSLSQDGESNYRDKDNIELVELSVLDRNNPFMLLLRIRDEAHRFAITGHRRKRNKAAMTTVLDGIKGLGDSRQRALIKYFGGISPVKNASIEELGKVPGFGKNLATSVFKQLHR